MVTKLNNQIIGLQEVIHGKLKEQMLLIQSDSMVISRSIRMEILKEQIGKVGKW